MPAIVSVFFYFGSRNIKRFMKRLMYLFLGYLSPHF
nr:MAG TPA: hypothetical protein [Caudoviricetes sp.]